MLRAFQKSVESSCSCLSFVLAVVPRPPATCILQRNPSFLSLPPQTQTAALSTFPFRLNPNPNLITLPLSCSSSSAFHFDDDDQELQDSSQSEEDGVCIEIKKLESNSRRILSSVVIHAPLHAVWNVLTDYERLADFIPGLAVSQLLHKTPNYARLFQIGEQKLAFGLKFNARGIVDCYEKQLESLPSGSGQKRDIEFKMVEGDFQIFQGKWSIEQLDKGGDDDSLIDQEEIHTTLSYLVDVKPKLWLPVQLVEARLCKEIQVNLACIREEAQKQLPKTLRTF